MADINDFNNEMNDVVSGVEPVKKRTGAVVGGIAAGVVAVAVVGGVAAYSLSDFVKNQVKLRISKPENYYAWVTEKNSSELASQIADRYREIIEERKNGQHTQLSLKYEASDEMRDMLLEKIGDNNSNAELIGNFKDLKLGVDAMSKDLAMSGNVYAELNGENLLNVEMAADMQALDLFFRLPGLSDQWMMTSEAFDEEEIAEAASDLESIITPDELEQLAAKYVDLYNSLITDIEIEKKEEIAIGDISVEYTVAEITLTEKQCCDIAVEFINTVKEDELIKSIMVDRTKSMTAEEYDEYLENELEDIQHDDDYEYSDKTAIFKTYIDPNGDIRGISIDSSRDDDTLRMIVGRDGDEIRGEAYVTDDGEEEFRADLKMTESDKVYNGSLVVNSNEETVSVEFTDLSAADEKKGYINGNISISTPEEQSYVLALMSDGSSQQIAADVVVEDVNYGKLTVEIAVENSAEPTVPDKSGAYDVDSDDADFPKDYVEQDTLTDFIKDIFEKLGMADAQEYAKYMTDSMYMSYDDIFDDLDYNGWDNEEIGYDDDELFLQDAVIDPYADDIVEVEDGQAYAMVMDNSFTSFYMGGSLGEKLSYGAKVADIKGDGTYTISVTADTDGYKKAAGDGVLPDGLYILGVSGSGIDGINNADITVKSVKIDGKEYLESDSSVMSAFDDSFEILLYSEGADNVIDGSSVGEWTDIEITFEVKGLK